MAEIVELASGLQFPEGPIAMPNGSVVLVEIKRGTLTRVTAEGKVEVVAEPGGGPNGAAIGPDGKVYVCNNGGCFDFQDRMGLTVPGPFDPAKYSGGRIERIDLDAGTVEVVYTECDGRPLRAPNDLVFDSAGGFWFTDHGIRQERSADRTGIFYAQPDGSSIIEAVHPLDSPNGVGLSPDGTHLYAAETHAGRVWQWEITAPGEVAQQPPAEHGGRILAGLPGLQYLDSLAVDRDGNVCVATIINGGITVISPDGERVDHVPFPDPLVTNVCFGGPDGGTAYVTLSGTGRLVSIDWPAS